MSGPRAPGLLRVEHLSVTFTGGREVPAVRDVGLALEAGESRVILGESGSGKSVTARTLLGLHRGPVRVAGSIRLNGTELVGAAPEVMRRQRGPVLGLVPQDPAGSLDPLRRIGPQIVEVMRVHGVERRRRPARERAEAMLARVGLADPARVFDSRPHELSGGMKQRAAIAMAVVCSPALLIADEPTTALDVTVQAQVIELFAELQRDLGMALLMITHDVGVAKDIGGSVTVMYAGRVVEEGAAATVLGTPRHPYTAALVAAVPRPGQPRGGLAVIPGRPPVPGEVADIGCAFAPRCAHVRDDCRERTPALLAVPGGGRIACPVVAPEPVRTVEGAGHG